jgi:alpha-L-arabinofuranosidase
MDGKPVAGVEGQDGLFASAVWDSDSQSYIVKVINTSDKAQPVELSFAGLGKKESLADGTITTFHSDNPDLDNTVDNPTAIIPVESKITIEDNTLKTEVGAKSFAMYKFKKIKK